MGAGSSLAVRFDSRGDRFPPLASRRTRRDPRSDPFWTRLTSHWREPLTATDPARLEAALRSHCVSLARHDRDTAHVGALLLRAADALRASPRARPDASVEAVNAVTLVSVILRHLADRPSEHAALHRSCHLPRSPDGTPTSVSPARAFLAAVVDTLRARPDARQRQNRENEYAIRVACARSLLACASPRARDDRPPRGKRRTTSEPTTRSSTPSSRRVRTRPTRPPRRRSSRRSSVASPTAPPRPEAPPLDAPSRREPSLEPLEPREPMEPSRRD